MSKYFALRRSLFVKLELEPQAKQNLILIVIQFCVARNSTNGGRNTFCNAPRGVHEDVWSLYFPEMVWMMRILWLCRHWPGALEESARSVPPNSVLGHLVGHPLLHTQCSWPMKHFIIVRRNTKTSAFISVHLCSKSRIWNEKVVT